MLLFATFAPSILLGIVIGIRNDATEGFAAFCCSAILNGVVAYGLTH